MLIDTKERTYIRRAYKISSSEDLFDQELDKTQRVLMNNGYSKKQFHKVLWKFKSFLNNAVQVQTAKKISIFNKNQMLFAYKIDERVLKTILNIVQNIVINSHDTKLNLLIYYINTKTSNLIMKNNLHIQGKLKSSNVIHRFKCPPKNFQLRPKEYFVGCI